MRLGLHISAVFLAATGLCATPCVGADSTQATMKSLAGVWSFDGSCASGDGMTLSLDGRAGFDEWGAGLWALADQGRRIVLLVENITEEADRPKVPQLIEYKISFFDKNKITLVNIGNGALIAARRCAAN